MDKKIEDGKSFASTKNTFIVAGIFYDETYESLEYLYYFAGIKELEDLEVSGELLGLSCCSDFKAIKIFLGIDQGKCKYPCISCYFNGAPNQDEKEAGSFWKQYDLRTNQSWSEDIENMKLGKAGIDCNSIIEKPISAYLAANTIERITAPTLHINLGLRLSNMDQTI